jgi:four helix bundle protein
MAAFEKLKVWKVAHALVLDVYRVTGKFPRAEMFGLSSQARRAAVSITANIAESAGRTSSPDQARFLQIAKGSAQETRSHFLIARDLGFLPLPEHKEIDSQLISVELMLSSLLRYHRSRA